MPKLRVVPPDEIERLRVQVVEEVELGCTPAELFASFQRDEDWEAWLDLEVKRTTEGPYREGFTRTVVGGSLVLDEVFHLWSPDHEMAFYVEHTNNPFLTAFAERYTVTPSASGCVLRWRIGMDFNLVGRLIAPLFKRALTKLARRGFPKLDRVARGGGSPS